jgi:hypothetical protein
MGTSASSKGPAGGVPMVPPWVPDLPPTTPDGDGDASPPADNGGEPAELSPNQNADALPQAPVPDRPMAPAARFTGARRNLGSFAKTGNSGDMRRGLGQYVRSGYGGARTATRRFGGTASTAGALRGALYALAQGQPAGPDGQLNRTLLQGRSAREVVDAVVEALLSRYPRMPPTWPAIATSAQMAGVGNLIFKSASPSRISGIRKKASSESFSAS